MVILASVAAGLVSRHLDRELDIGYKRDLDISFGLSATQAMVMFVALKFLKVVIETLCPLENTLFVSRAHVTKLVL